MRNPRQPLTGPSFESIRAGREMIVFDWDGTVVDSIMTIVRAMQFAAADLDLPVPSDQRARHVIGLGLADALRHAMPDLPPQRTTEFVARYRHHFLGVESADVPFEGIESLLGALDAEGLRLAVATGKSRVGLDRALRRTGFGAYFAQSRCADEGHSKPHPWMLQSLAAASDISAGQMLMIGDTSHDIEMARAFGAASIGVVYGAHEAQAVAAAGPDAIAASVDELSRLLGIGS